VPPNKRLQLTSARFGCRSVPHGRRPPGWALDSRASAGRHSEVHGAAAAEPRSVRRPRDFRVLTGVFPSTSVAATPAR
jgi:hypothetical protein